MDRQDNPKFSYIKVGNTTNEPDLSTDEEELIVIGVLDSETAITQEISGNTETGVSRRNFELGGKREDVDRQRIEDKVEEQENEDIFGSKMSIMQKIVLAVCIIASIVAAIYIVWYRTTQA